MTGRPNCHRIRIKQIKHLNFSSTSILIHIKKKTLFVCHYFSTSQTWRENIFVFVIQTLFKKESPKCRGKYTLCKTFVYMWTSSSIFCHVCILSAVVSVCCVTHRFAGGLLQKLHCFLPFVLLVLLTHLQRGSLLLVFYVLLLGESVSIFNNGYCLPLALLCEM